jgi:5-methyltetrahydropteroyltriglutamate--homocysteine methyltransferase
VGDRTGRDQATRAETVGSMLRPEEVKQAVPPDGSQPGEAAREVLDDAVLEAIAIQEGAGLDIITDGEMRRWSWAQTPRFLDCFERRQDTGPHLDWRGGTGPAPGQPGTALAFPVVVRRVSEAGRTGSMADEYAFLAKHAHTRTKFTMAAPSYHRRYWSDTHSAQAYGSCEEFLTEIRDYLREVCSELAALGCDYIQLDAPNYGSYCDLDTRARMTADGRDLAADLAFDAELDSSLLDGAADITRALHICRGNGPGGRWHSAGGYGAVSAELFPLLRFDRLLLEYDSDRAGDFAPLADVRPGTVAVLGLLTTKSGQLEHAGVISGRIAEAAGVKPLDELALSTQCGFGSVISGNPLTRAEQRAKLELVAGVAHRTWRRAA